jgi:hypothetical protein
MFTQRIASVFHAGRLPLRASVAALLLGMHAGVSAQGALVGILEGRATLLRTVGKFELAEGVALREADIVETAPAGFVQIELADGVRIGLGENSRLMLAPPGTPLRARLLQGWMKLTPGADKVAPGEFATPRLNIGALAGTAVVSADPAQYALFVESGTLAITERGSAAPRPAKAGDFLAGRTGATLTLTARPMPDFLERLPRPFRDALPARAAKFRDRPTTARALGDVGYDEVAPWLVADDAARAPLHDAWRPRLNDKAFRDAVLAHVTQHPEWRPIVLPPKKPEVKARPADRPRPSPAAAPKAADTPPEPAVAPAPAPASAATPPVAKASAPS